MVCRETTKKNRSLKKQMIISSNQNEAKKQEREFGVKMVYFLIKELILIVLKKNVLRPR